MRRLAAFFLVPSSIAFASCSSNEPPSGAPALVRAPSAIVATLSRAFPIHPGKAPAGLHAVVPKSARDALRVELDPQIWIELRPHGAADVPAHDEGGVTVYAGALEGADLVYVEEASRVEELRLAHTRAAAAKSAWDVRLGPGLAGLRVKDGRLEAYDAKGRIRLGTEPAWAEDASGTRRALAMRVEGSTLIATLDVDGLVPPIAIDPAWTSLASMSVSRVFPMLAKLSNGKILVAGGTGDASMDELSSAELYDPATNTFASTTTPMAYRRTGMETPAITYEGGKKVLLTNGRDEGGAITDEAEIYDADTGLFTKSKMPVASREHTAVTLKDGRIALVGGVDDHHDYIQTIRIFHPATKTWSTSAPHFDEGRVAMTATVLGDGKVFITGGRARSGPPGSSVRRFLNEPNLWDPATDTVQWLARMPTGREQHGAHLLTTGPHAGKVMVFGGFISGRDDGSTTPSAGSVLYDPATDKWTIGPFLSKPRTFVAWSVLSDGRLLVSGGTTVFGASFTPEQTAEIFDPVKLAWSSAGTLKSPRGAHGQISLGAGEALLVGGAEGAKEGFIDLLTSSEKFVLQATGQPCAAAGECTTGFCVDGVCCATACDGQCEACDVAGKAGTCSPVSGAPHGARAACDPDADPANACARTCDGVDTAKCNFPGSSVACSANTCVAGVETHASTCDGAGACGDVPRACGDFACDATACKTTCTSKADCVNPNHFCEAGKCIPVQPSGMACTRDEACASGNCVDGICCESKCEGQCQACDVPGQAGKCVAVKGKPHGARPACSIDATDACKSTVCDGTNTVACAGTIGPCGSYACDTASLSCKSSCVGAADCAPGYECDDGKCIPRTSKCTPDLTGMVGTDGATTSCSPFLCRDGQCLPLCTSSNDCQGGFVCDSGGKCVAPAAAASAEEGGCAVRGPDDSSRGFALAVGLALAALARRRRAHAR